MSEPHRFPTWNYWEDTDASGIVYYANYLRFPERGRCDLVREAVIDQVALLDTEGVMLPVQHCEINFLRPAHLDDQNEARARIQKIAIASMEMGPEIHRSNDHIVRTKVRLDCVRRSGRPRRPRAHSRSFLNESAIAS